MTPLHLCLVFSILLFAIGFAAVLARSSSILVLLGIELMLNAANINFVAFWHYSPTPNQGTGIMFAIFAIAVAAAEAAVGLALIIALYRRQRNIRLQDATTLKG